MKLTKLATFSDPRTCRRGPADASNSWAHCRLQHFNRRHEFKSLGAHKPLASSWHNLCTGGKLTWSEQLKKSVAAFSCGKPQPFVVKFIQFHKLPWISGVFCHSCHPRHPLLSILTTGALAFDYNRSAHVYSALKSSFQLQSSANRFPSLPHHVRSLKAPIQRLHYLQLFSMSSPAKPSTKAENSFCHERTGRLCAFITWWKAKLKALT